ncbi:MAG: SURF1 family protein [Betaproteobacteria bacterium]
MAMSVRASVWVALAVGVAGTWVAYSLGSWQTKRAEGKLAVEARWRAAESAAPRDVSPANTSSVRGELPQRVRLRGQFAHEKSVWLDNRPLDGRAGMILLAPLVLDDSASGRATVVLVMRGWAPRDMQERARLPKVAQPRDPIVVEGLALPHPPRVYELSDVAEPATLPALWQNLDYAEYAKASGLHVEPWVVQQQGGADDGLVRAWTRPASGVEKHRGYALQWYSLAGLIAVLTLVLGARALRRK